MGNGDENFVQMKDHAFFQRAITFENLFQNPRVNFNQTWHKAFLGDEDSQNHTLIKEKKIAK